MKELISLQDEDRNGFLVSSKRKKIWNVQLNILMHIDALCKRHNLRYFLDSGTLLGAVRHQGFIPWDDDIDILMPRDDYDKLLQISKEAFCEPFYFQTIYSDPKYPGIHAKVRYTQSTAIIKSWLFTDVNQGIFVDIFPLDGVPDNEDKRKELFEKNSKLGRAIKSYYNYDHILSLNPKIIRLLLKRRKLAKSLIKGERDYVLQFESFENNFREYSIESCKQLGSLAIGLPDQRYFIFDKSWFANCEYLNFEGISLPVPCGYKNVLEVYFGKEYMTPKQYPSDHGLVYLDPDVCYEEYLHKLRKDYSLLNRIIRLFKQDPLSKLEKKLYEI